MNNKSLNENTAIFLTILNLKILEKIIANKRILGKEETLKNIIGKVFFDFNQKMGIPFVSTNEGIHTHIKNLITNVRQVYFECSALNELLENRNYSNEIGDYIKYKIELVFFSNGF